MILSPSTAFTDVSLVQMGGRRLHGTTPTKLFKAKAVAVFSTEEPPHEFGKVASDCSRTHNNVEQASCLIGGRSHLSPNEIEIWRNLH